MPEGDIEALRELLPFWVHAIVWAGLPVVGLVFAMFCAWLADRLNRPNFEGLHWTEKARLHFAGTKVVSSQALTYAVMTSVIMFMMPRGILLAIDPVRHAVIAGLFIWLATLVVKFRRARHVLPWLTAGEFVAGKVFWWLVFLPILVVAGVMALFGPAELGWTFALVYGGGALAMIWAVRGGAVALGRWFGVIIPADERIARIVAEAAARTGHTPARTWFGRTPMANAVAFPVTNELLFTTRVAAEMTDAELFAITLHEIGHLKESKGDVSRRLMAVSLFLVLGMWRPIVGSLGLVWFVVLTVLGLALAVLGLRTAQRLETEADHHVHEHQEEDEEGTYARALERLHEVNIAPAVLRGKNNTHPHLYDRMTAAGVTPDYPRPKPPPQKIWQFVLFCVIALVVVFASIFTIQMIKNRAYAATTNALWAIAVSGGEVWTIGALGAKWENGEPEKAAVALAVAAAHSDWPEYAARLARVLADTDPEAARAALARAEKRLDEWDEVDEWLRDIVDSARIRLGMPERDW